MEKTKNITNGNVFLRHPIFTNRDKKELLPLSIIIKNKIITEIKISYLSLPKKVKIGGFLGFLGLTTYTQKEKILIIHDKNGIHIDFSEENSLVSVKFSKGNDYLKIGQDYDQNTLRPMCFDTKKETHQFMVQLSKNNLKNVFWEEKN